MTTRDIFLTSNNPITASTELDMVCRIWRRTNPKRFTPGIKVVGIVVMKTLVVSLVRPIISCTEFVGVSTIVVDEMFSAVKLTVMRRSGIMSWDTTAEFKNSATRKYDSV
jgi:hypothetical protein